MYYMSECPMCGIQCLRDRNIASKLPDQTMAQVDAKSLQLMVMLSRDCTVKQCYEIVKNT